MNLKYKKMKFQLCRKLAAVGFLLFSANASAEIVVEHTGQIQAGTEYHSNIQYLERGAQSAYVYSLVPQYQIELLDGVNEWFGLIGVTLQRSSNTTVSRRREDPFANIGWKRDLENGGMLGIKAGYLQESTRTAQLFATGLVAEDGTSVTRDVVADWVTPLTERLDLKLQAAYEKTTFSEIIALVGFSVRNVNAELHYKLNEKVTPFIRVADTDYRAETKIEFQDVLAGAEVNLSPQLKIKAGAGITHFTTSGLDDEAVGFIEADYIRPRSSTRVALSREVFTTGDNTIDLGDRLSLAHQYSLSERSRLGANLDLGQNQSGQENQDLLGFYERDLTTSWMMRLYMGLSNIKDEDRSSANDNLVGFSFIYSSPF